MQIETIEYILLGIFFVAGAINAINFISYRFLKKQFLEKHLVFSTIVDFALAMSAIQIAAFETDALQSALLLVGFTAMIAWIIQSSTLLARSTERALSAIKT